MIVARLLVRREEAAGGVYRSGIGSQLSFSIVGQRRVVHRAANGATLIRGKSAFLIGNSTFDSCLGLKPALLLLVPLMWRIHAFAF